jgi:pimeloyl-ACP methyl ester carboxylesterase
MPSFAIKVIRFGFAAVGSVSPKAAGYLAFKLFCLTPSRRPKTAKAKAADAEGRRRLATAEELPFPVGRVNVMGYRFNGGGASDRPRYLVVHGWGSSAAYISALAAGLAEGGAEVVVLDLPGHGRSGGRFLHLRFAAETIAEAERRFGPFDAAVGHSFGGASLILTAGGVMRGVGELSVSRLVLIGSPSHVRWLFEGFSRMLALSQRVKMRLIERAETIAGAKLGDFDAVPVARRLRKPLLVVHAPEDKEVDAAHARRYEHISFARHLWADGLGHRRIVSAPEVISAIRSFLEEDIAEDERVGRAGRGVA